MIYDQLKITSQQDINELYYFIGYNEFIPSIIAEIANENKKS